MKKFGFAVSVVALVLGMSITPCLAADDSAGKSDGAPQVIIVDGGRLELDKSASDEASKNGNTRYMYHVVTDGSNLNVRSGPGLQYSIIGKFANGQLIDVPFAQPAGIYPWVTAGGTDVITGNWINGYIHSDYYQ